MSIKSRNGKWFGVATLVLLVTGLCGCAASNRKQATPTEQLKVLSESTMWDKLDESDVAKVRKVINAGADVNVCNKHGVTPLYRASYGGHAALVKLLLEANANVNAAKTTGATPLYVASQNGHTETVKLLLQARADVNAVRPDGFTPLWQASRGGHAAVVKLLLDAQVDVNAKARVMGEYYTPLSAARTLGHAEVVRLLLEAKNDVKPTDIGQNASMAKEQKDATKQLRILSESLDATDITKLRSLLD